MCKIFWYRLLQKPPLQKTVSQPRRVSAAFPKGILQFSLWSVVIDGKKQFSASLLWIWPRRAMASSGLKVIIVGGSIAGLTLAHCLERAGIEYVVLEKGSDPAPQVGASIGILPNGARILDQLKLYDEVESHIEPLETATMCYPDGLTFQSSYPKLIHQRSV